MTLPTIRFEVKPLKRLAELRISNVDKKSNDEEIQVRLCNYTDVYYADTITDENDFMIATATSEELTKFRLKIGDVLITKDSEDYRDIGVPAYVAVEAFDLVCGYHLAILRPDQKVVHPRFLFWAIASRFVSHQLSATATGLTRYGLRQDSIASASIPYAPLDTQRAIAQFLDRETEQIDQLVMKKKRLIELLENKRTALISHAVTKGLDPSIPMKDSGINWLGDIPAHWEVMSLKRVAQIRYGLSQPPPTKDEGIPIIRATNINAGRISKESMIYAAIEDLPLDRVPLLEADEILVVRSGAFTGDSAIIPSEYEGAAPGYDLRVTVNGAEPRFIAWLLLGQLAKSQIDLAKNRAAQPHINADEVGSIMVTIPPPLEQIDIADHLDALDFSLRSVSEKLSQQLDKIVEYRLALITAAVTGEIDSIREIDESMEVIE